MAEHAEFEVVKRPRPTDRPLYPTKVTRCTVCGWETEAKDTSLYGSPNALTLAKLSHRLAHLEGRIPFTSKQSDRVED